MDVAKTFFRPFKFERRPMKKLFTDGTSLPTCSMKCVKLIMLHPGNVIALWQLLPLHAASPNPAQEGLLCLCLEGHSCLWGLRCVPWEEKPARTSCSAFPLSSQKYLKIKPNLRTQYVQNHIPTTEGKRGYFARTN